jgi:hypothetical protein
MRSDNSGASSSVSTTSSVEFFGPPNALPLDATDGGGGGGGAGRKEERKKRRRYPTPQSETES